jgi:hypothetical protein
MTTYLWALTRVVTIAAAGLLVQGNAVAQDQISQSPLTITGDGQTIHILPTVNDAAAFAQANADAGPLIYHPGGSVMNPSVTIYPIFWVPAKLQSGGPTGMSGHYQSVQIAMLADYAGHGIGNVNTQYYQKSGSTITYIQNKGGFGTGFLDTSPYPASGCTDRATPGNCLTDAQIRAEVVRVMQFAHLTGGLNKIFMVFTSSGEGSCFDGRSTSCAYTNYCAYHSYFRAGSTPVVYANEPYGSTSNCQIQGVPSPNNDPVADAAATAASHELSEAITDPLLNAWFTARGNENGDLCAYKYGRPTWDGGKANQMWNGRFYLLQQEFSNHTNSCVQVGP